MKISAGTLEGFLYGFNLSEVPNDSDENELSMTYGYRVHEGCVKALAVATSGSLAGATLVTGGVDERIKIYDIDEKREKGNLEQHSGAVTCLEFFGSSHLFSGSEDKTLCIWRVNDWALLHVLGGHKGPITSLSIHPTGRLLLSVSTDRTLRLWNTIEGRLAYIKRLPGGGDIVRWSSTGSFFAVIVQSKLLIYESQSSESPTIVEFSCKINCMTWVSDSIVALSFDNHVIKFIATSGQIIHQVQTDDICKGRIRDMVYSQEDNDSGYLSAVTSNGRVQIWNFNLQMQTSESKIETLEPKLGQKLKSDENSICLKSAGQFKVPGEPRFTCLTSWPSNLQPIKKRKNKKRSKEKATKDEISVENSVPSENFDSKNDKNSADKNCSIDQADLSDEKVAIKEVIIESSVKVDDRKLTVQQKKKRNKKARIAEKLNR